MAEQHEIPLELLGSKNFPDIELENCLLDPHSLVISGDVQLYDVLDTLMIDGQGDLIANVPSSAAITISHVAKADPLDTSSRVTFAQVQILTVKHARDLMIDGMDHAGNKLRATLPNASLFWKPAS